MSPTTPLTCRIFAKTIGGGPGILAKAAEEKKKLRSDDENRGRLIFLL